MDDIHVFIILFLALIFLCRLSKEGFEEMEPGGVPREESVDEVEGEGEESKESVDDVGGEGTQPPPPPPPPPQKEDNFQGWDKRKIFSSPDAPNFGSLLKLEEIQHLNNLFSKRNVDPNVPPNPIDSQMPSLLNGSTVPNMLHGNGGNGHDHKHDNKIPLNGGIHEHEHTHDGGLKHTHQHSHSENGNVELHMVYADWCGHSKNALGDFEGLVDKTDVKTSSGETVKFVLTEQKSDGFKEFKGKVKGYPTYMLKKGSELTEIDVGDRSESAIIEAVQKL